MQIEQTPAPAPILRRARADDAAALADLKLTCFRETFLEDLAVPYPPDDLARFIAETYVADRVTAEIADETHATWVCEAADGSLLAYAHAGPSKLPHPEMTPTSAELYQLYARRDAQGLGLGRQLMAAAFDWLGETYPGPIWIGVWSENHRAQAIYSRAGFEKVGGYHFMVGDHRDDEFIFRRD